MRQTGGGGGRAWCFIALLKGRTALWRSEGGGRVVLFQLIGHQEDLRHFDRSLPPSSSSSSPPLFSSLAPPALQLICGDAEQPHS